jgi:hypothetical protein
MSRVVLRQMNTSYVKRCSNLKEHHPIYTATWYIKSFSSNKVRDNRIFATLRNYSTSKDCVCGLYICQPYICPAMGSINYTNSESPEASLAPYQASTAAAVDLSLLFIKELQESKEINEIRLVDLGCGDGRVLIRALSSLQEVTNVTGYEYNINTYKLCIENIKIIDFNLYSRISIHHDDVFNISTLHDYNILYLFLLPGGLKRLNAFILDKISTTSLTYIISIGWEVSEWKPWLYKSGMTSGGCNVFMYKVTKKIV